MKAKEKLQTGKKCAQIQAWQPKIRQCITYTLTLVYSVCIEQMCNVMTFETGVWLWLEHREEGRESEQSIRIYI